MVAPELKRGIGRICALLGIVAASVIAARGMAWVGLASAAAAGGCGAGAMAIVYWIGRRGEAYRRKNENNVMMETLRIMSAAVEVKNAADFGHVSRVALLAEQMGRAKGLSERALDRLRVAAYLHDIGKLAIPIHTLRRKDALTEDEWEMIRTHPSIGAVLLAGSGMDTGIVEAVRHHHENWDGSGYPEGLSGGKIPISARILAAADTCDALLRPRSDREKYSLAEAKAMLQLESGRKLDPSLIVPLMEVLDDPKVLSSQGAGNPAQGRAAVDPSADKGAHGCGLGEAVRGIWSSEADGPLAFAASLSACRSVDAVMTLAIPKIRLLVPYKTAVLYTLDERTGTIGACFAEGGNASQFQKITMVKGHGITGWAIANNRDIVANHAEMDFRPDIREEMPRFSHAAAFVLSSSTDRQVSFGALTLYLDGQESMPVFLRRRIKQLVEQISGRLEQLLENELTRSSPLSDPVTHLPTLSLLYAHAAREIAQARRHSYAVSFMEMELDNYQDILQRNGKEETEKFLRELAKSVRRYLRDGDVLARISESEFAGVFPMTAQAQVQFLVRRLRSCIEQFEHRTPAGGSIQAEVSFGCATFPEQGKTCESLFLRANTQRFADKMHQASGVAAGGGMPYGKVLPFRL